MGHCLRVWSIWFRNKRAGGHTCATYSSLPSRDLRSRRVIECLADQVDTRSRTLVSFSGVRETVIFQELTWDLANRGPGMGFVPCDELIVPLVWLARPVDDESVAWQCVHQLLLHPNCLYSLECLVSSLETMFMTS